MPSHYGGNGRNSRMGRNNGRMGRNNGRMNRTTRTRVNRSRNRTSGMRMNGNGNGYSNGSVRNNLVARPGQFVNATTGAPYSGPMHMHEGRAMVGATHSSTPHDYLRRVNGNGNRQMRRATPMRGRTGRMNQNVRRNQMNMRTESRRLRTPPAGSGVRILGCSNNPGLCLHTESCRNNECLPM